MSIKLPPIALSAFDRLHFVGDSVIELATLQMLQMQVANLYAARTLPQNSAAVGYRTQSTIPAPVITYDGLSATGIANIDTNFATRVTAYNPTVLVIQVSVNDLGNPTYTTSANSVAAKANALGANVRICWMSCLFGGPGGGPGGGEIWHSDGWHDADGNNGAVRGLNNTVLPIVSANNHYYMNIRGDAITDPNTILNWESTHNLPEPGIFGNSPGVTLSVDGIHPFTGINGGNAQGPMNGAYPLCQMILANFTFA